MTSKIRWVVLPAEALYTADNEPVADSGTVRLLARLSPSGKLRVELAGVLVAVGVTATYPEEVCWVTVTAVHGHGTGRDPPTPATCHVRATAFVNLPDKPLPIRESRRISGSYTTARTATTNRI